MTITGTESPYKNKTYKDFSLEELQKVRKELLQQDYVSIEEYGILIGKSPLTIRNYIKNGFVKTKSLFGTKTFVDIKATEESKWK